MTTPTPAPAPGRRPMQPISAVLRADQVEALQALADDARHEGVFSRALREVVDAGLALDHKGIFSRPLGGPVGRTQATGEEDAE